MSSESAEARFSRDTLRLFGGAGVLITIIFSISFFSLKHIRQTTLNTANQYILSYSKVVANQAESAIHSTDIVLSSVADYLARSGVNDAKALAHLSDASTFHRLLKDRLTGMPQIASFMLIDSSGKIVATSYDSLPKDVDLSDREYFRALRDDPTLESFLSEPVKSRISGSRVFLLVRRLSDPDGAFMGLLVGSLSQRHFEDYYAATAGDGQTTIELKRTDGAMLAAHFPGAGQPPPTISMNADLRLHRAGDSAALVSEDRLQAFRRIANFPMVVSVSQTYDNVLREWRKIAWLTGSMSAAIAGLLVAFSSIVARNWRSQASFLSRLTTSEALAQLRSQQFEATLANLPQGVCMYDKSGQVIVVNDQYARLYDLEPYEIAAGATLEMVVDRRIARGCFPGSDPESYRRSETRPQIGVEPILHRLPNGRVLAISRYAMENGGWISHDMDVTDEHQAIERVHFLAHHDSLTQLCNRAQFLEKMNAALEYLRRGMGAGFCIHMLDLDMFKAVNDTLGHGVGDKLLQQVGDRLRETTRNQDVVARLGGDEFAVIQRVEIPRGREDAASLADRLLQRIAEPYAIDGNNVVIGTSIGVAQAPNDGLEVDELMAKADLALYKAKASGRNTLRFFDASLESEARQRQNLQLDLHAALAGEEFELRYQPIVAAATGDIVCAEALVRWRHPRDGLIGPDRFIPVAEESGLIVGIGEWVLRHACLDALSWPDSVRIAVNISPVQLKKGDLVATIECILAETGIAAQRLELEITEGVFLQNREESLSIITKLKTLGVTISLDDFGTGYSSLAYIRSFPLDKIKIDKSFVAEATQRRDCAAIVSAIVYLARSLNISTVAEGVENEEQHQFVRAAGCTYFQGYYFGHPDTAEAFVNNASVESRNKFRHEYHI